MIARPTKLIADIMDSALLSDKKCMPLIDYVVYLERCLTEEKTEVDELSTELYRKIDTLSTNNALLGKTITRLSHRLEMIRGITKTLASTVETLSDSD